MDAYVVTREQVEAFRKEYELDNTTNLLDYQSVIALPIEIDKQAMVMSIGPAGTDLKVSKFSDVSKERLVCTTFADKAAKVCPETLVTAMGRGIRMNVVHNGEQLYGFVKKIIFHTSGVLWIDVLDELQDHTCAMMQSAAFQFAPNVLLSVEV